jgi:hypothetical protein
MVDNYNPLALGEPVFKTREEYNRFREEFQREMEPKLKAQAKARMESEIWAMTHFVD